MSDVELKEFIAETLKSISIGVREAQDFSKEKDGIPIGLWASGGERTTQGEQLVNFSVTIDAEKSDSKSVSADGGATIISVVSAKVGFKKAWLDRKQSKHTVEFSVPMHFNSKWSKDEAK